MVGVRVVVELKKDASTAASVQKLFSQTGLQSSFAGNMLMLEDSGQTPKLMDLKGILQSFVKFR
jgi:DNA gyrase subunit A